MVSPSSGMVQTQFQRCILGKPRIIWHSCIINNEAGEWLLKQAKLIKLTSNNLAELEAVLEGIKLCIKLGLTKVIIEGDSQIVINALRKKSTPNWVLNSKLEEVLKIIEDLVTLQLTHIFREGNIKADKLPNLGADGENFIKINNFNKI